MSQEPQVIWVCADPLGATSVRYGYRMAPANDEYLAYLVQEADVRESEGRGFIDIAYLTHELHMGPLGQEPTCGLTEPNGTTAIGVMLRDLRYLESPENDGKFDYLVGDIVYVEPADLEEPEVAKRFGFAEGTVPNEPFYILVRSLYHLTAGGTIRTLEAMATYVYLIWGRPDFSIAPLEYEVIVRPNPAVESIEDYLASTSVYQPVPGLTAMVEHVIDERDYAARAVKNNEGLPDGKVKFFLQRIHETGLFALIPSEGYQFTTHLLNLAAHLNSALLADFLLQQIKNRHFRESNFMFALAKLAAYRRIAKRAKFPFSLEEIEEMREMVVAQQSSWQQIDNIETWVAQDEVTARLHLGFNRRTETHVRPLLQEVCALDLGAHEAVYEFELPPHDALPLIANDPNDPGHTALPTAIQNEEMYHDYVFGQALALANLTFNAVPTLDRVVVNGFAPKPDASSPAHVIEPRGPQDRHYVLSMDISREALRSSYGRSVAYSLYAAVNPEGTFYTRVGCLDPKLYATAQPAPSVIPNPEVNLPFNKLVALDPADKDGRFSTVVPFLSAEELNQQDLCLPNPLVDPLMKGYRPYEPTFDELQAFSQLQSANVQAQNMLASPDSDAQAARLLLKKALRENASVIKKFFDTTEHEYKIFNGTLPYLLYVSHYDLGPRTLVVDSGLADFFHTLGSCDAILGNHEEAYHAFSNSFKLAPADPSIHLDLAWLSYLMKDEKTARIYLEEAAKFILDEEDAAQMYYTYGVLASQREQYVEAAVYLMKGMEQFYVPQAFEELQEISDITGTTNAGVTSENLDALAHQYRIPPHPIKMKFDLLNDYMESFVNARDFTNALEVLYRLYPITVGPEIPDLIVSLPGAVNYDYASYYDYPEYGEDDEAGFGGPGGGFGEWH